MNRQHGVGGSNVGRVPRARNAAAAGGIALVLVAAVVAGCGTSPSASGPAGAARLAASSLAVSSASPVPTASPVATEDAAAQLQADFVRIVKEVGPSVVVITTDSGLGSGVVFDDRGDIITNAHVVADSASFRVTTSDGHEYSARLVGSFAADDLAVLHVTGGSLHPAKFGDSSRLVVGDIVIAVGNPLGLQSSVTEGMVSALGRTVSEPDGAALPDVIQTSAPINPGNSGGALVDLAGEVIGIPTLTATDPELGGSAPGIGFAIPSSTATDIATQLISSGKVTNSHRAYLGIEAADVTAGGGAYVVRVTPGSPAASAGIPANVLILSIAGQPTPSAAELLTVLANLAPGQHVAVLIERPDGTKTTLDVTLGQLASGVGAGPSMG